MTFFLAVLVAFLASSASMPVIIRWAHKRGHFDAVGGRKIHKGEVPRLGGVGINIGFLAGFAVALAVVKLLYPTSSLAPSIWIIAGGGFGFHLLGLIDDFRSLRAVFKFLVQLVLALAVVAAGYHFSFIETPFPPYRLELGFMGPPLTILWIIGIANAINLMDGMDGLAGGIAFIAMGVWVAILFKSGVYIPTLAAAAAIGALLGFLFFNFPPATIFMGDSGSLLLGFILAVLPLTGVSEADPQTGMLSAMTICLVPIFDTLAAIIRRTRAGVSFFTPDRFHFHHKLMNLGFSTRQILAITYSFCLAFGASVLTGFYLKPVLAFAFMIGAWVVCLILFMTLHFLKEGNVTLIRRINLEEDEAGPPAESTDIPEKGKD